MDFNNPLFEELAKKNLEEELERKFAVTEALVRDLESWTEYNYITDDEETQDMLAEAQSLRDVPEYNVLIEGPSGTGKEIIAGILSFKNDRPTHKSINMSGLTDSLFESQLFGYVPGAFTGALAKGSEGFIRACRDGVAFFDEIGELPLSQQAKILRVIQAREVLPVGGVDSVKVGCRFVFATNRDLLTEVREGRFREDLYFRIRS